VLRQTEVCRRQLDIAAVRHSSLRRSTASMRSASPASMPRGPARRALPGRADFFCTLQRLGRSAQSFSGRPRRYFFFNGSSSSRASSGSLATSTPSPRCRRARRKPARQRFGCRRPLEKFPPLPAEGGSARKSSRHLSVTYAGGGGRCLSCAASRSKLLAIPVGENFQRLWGPVGAPLDGAAGGDKARPYVAEISRPRLRRHNTRTPPSRTRVPKPVSAFQLEITAGLLRRRARAVCPRKQNTGRDVAHRGLSPDTHAH